MIRVMAIPGAALAVFVVSYQVLAQDYPVKPIRLIVPFAPGGGTDIMARVIAQRCAETFRQTVVIDNRLGGGGTIGFEMAARASPDGYTLIVGSGSYSASAALYNLPYDAVNDIQPIIMIGETGLVLALHPSVPVRSVRELVAHAKTNPGRLTYGSGGTGSIAHLAAELFKLDASVDFTHIPYKGAVPALNALIGGEIQLVFTSLTSTVPHVKSGRLRAIGVTLPRRTAALPDVPAIGETVPGYEAIHWYGLWGPKSLPRGIVTLWNREVAKVLQTDEMKKRMAAETLDAAGETPEQFLNVIRRDVEKWKKLVKAVKITAAN